MKAIWDEEEEAAPVTFADLDDGDAYVLSVSDVVFMKVATVTGDNGVDWNCVDNAGTLFHEHDGTVIKPLEASWHVSRKAPGAEEA